MTATKRKTCDVFISHALADKSVAGQLAEVLASAGMEVIYAGNIDPGVDVSDAIWEALAESRALVAIVSPDTPTHAMGLVEIGAATAWNKPIFVLLNGPASTKLPATVAKYPVYLMDRLDDLIRAINSSFEPLSKQDREILAGIYKAMSVPADQLSQSPKALGNVARQFNRKTQRQLSGERILSELLRMRKQGQLPRLHAPAGKTSSLLKRNRLRPPKVKPSRLLK